MGLFFVIVTIMVFIAGFVSISYGEQKKKECVEINDKESYYHKRVSSVMLEIFGGLCLSLACILAFYLMTIAFGTNVMFGV